MPHKQLATMSPGTGIIITVPIIQITDARMTLEALASIDPIAAKGSTVRRYRAQASIDMICALRSSPNYISTTTPETIARKPATRKPLCD